MAADASDRAPEEKRGPSGLGWLLAVAIVALAAALILLGEGGPAPLRRGDVAPGFELPLIGQPGSRALADHAGQVVLVNFWATWCKPCEEEIPAMERLYEQLSPRGFELLAISVDDEEAPVQGFIDRMGLTFPVLHDADQSVSRTYQTMGYPESLLLDRNGVIVERYVGPKPWDEPDYVQRVERLLDAP
jgi:peroxiredoxin